MGYASTLLYGDNFQIGGEWTTLLVTAVIGNYALGTITLPDDMVVKKAYLDLSIRGISSSSGGAFNWLNANAQLVCHQGGPTAQSFEIASQSLYCFGTAVAPGCYLYGTTDVSSMFQGGATTSIQFNNLDALGANLALWDCQPVVRIIMR